MPSLIRLLVILLVLGGLVYGGMVALVMVVEPGEKDVTIRIPTRDLVPQVEREPLVRRTIDTSRTASDADAPAGEEAPATEAPAEAAAPEIDTVPANQGEDSSIVTLAPGTPE